MKKTVLSQFLFFWVFFLCFTVMNAQIPSTVSSPIPVKITDSGRLYSTFSLDTKTEYHAEIKKQTGTKTFADILLYGEEDSWPSDISTLDGRNRNRALMANYKTNLIAIFGDSYAILEIPVKGNEGMPSGMRPQTHVIYFVIGKDALELSGNSSASSTSGFPRVKIVDSGQLYSTYDIEAETAWHGPIKKAVGEKGLQDIIKYAKEENWPVGISNLDNWRENKLKMNNYTVYLLVDNLDGKIILHCPAAENQYMPSDLKPSRDIYFVMGSSGIEGGASVVQKVEEAEDEPASASKNIRYAEIVNPMELYSTFDIEENEDAIALYQELFGDEYIDRAIELSTEGGWPSGISTFSERDKVRPEFKDYTVYYLGEFMGTEPVAVLYVPTEDNVYMPDNMQPIDEDGMIFLFKKSAVEVGDLIESNELIENTQTDDFESQLNKIVNALADNFKFIKGNQINKEGNDFLMGKDYESTVVLQGSEQTYIHESLGGFGANCKYGEFRTKAEAKEVYDILVNRVRETKFNCCTLVENEQDLENLITTYWIPFDLSGKMDPRFSDMVIEVKIFKFLGIDENFKTYDSYTVSLNVYRQK